MKKITVFCILIIQALLLAGCKTGDKTKSDDDSDKEIRQNIVIICNRQQYNDHFSNSGYFIDNHGNKRYFDLSNESADFAKDINKLYEYLNKNIDKYEKIAFLEKEKLNECYKYLNLVDKNAKITEECVMVDYGSYYLYGTRLSDSGNVECILLEEYGDWNRVNTDENAGKIMELIGKDTWRDHPKN